MRKKLSDIASAVYYFLPVQLFIQQLRVHKLFLGLWAFLFLSVMNRFGERFGIPYLFLEPEYLGQVGFLSMLLMGVGLGAFISAFNIATYISDSYQFYFIAMENRPFRTYFMNNCLLPVAFLIVFTIRFFSFGIYLRGHFEWELVWMLFGFFTGMTSVILLTLVYFGGTTRTARKIFGEDVIRELKSRRVIIGKAKRAFAHQHRVDSFINVHLRLEKTIPTLHLELRKLVRILNQHHGNALFLSFLLILFVIGSGFLEGNPWFQVPAGLSLLIFFSIIVMLAAALNFWFRKLGPLLLILLVGVYFVLDQPSLSRNRHQALGLSYDVPPAAYTIENLRTLSTPAIIAQDKEAMISILNEWKRDFQINHPFSKPRAIILCTSGGGERSAYFTFRTLQVLDSITSGAFFDNTRLISGASGGMLGAGYYRELTWLGKRQMLPENTTLHDRKYAANVSKDLLNRICFKLVSGLFLPGMKETVGDQHYVSDRGFSFDDQVMTNMPELRNVRLSDYTEPEKQALIPVMVLSPVLLNDGRKMFISATHTSFFTRSDQHIASYERGVTGVEFTRLFEKQEADSLLFVTALRMNATFPLITPYIQLPSEPPTKLIDAGIADNYGLQIAAEFLRIFRDWINENTDGVMVVQIRDSENESLTLPRHQRSSLIDQVMDPIGSTYSSFMASRDHLNDDYLQFAQQLLGDKFQYARLEYAPADSMGVRASLSWHLTEKEKTNIEASLKNSFNRKGMDKVQSFLQPAVVPQ